MTGRRNYCVVCNVRVIFIVLMMISLSSCDPTKNNLLAPNKRVFKQLPKQAEFYPDYKQGWL